MNFIQDWTSPSPESFGFNPRPFDISTAKRTPLELSDQLLVCLIVDSDALHHKKRLLVCSIPSVTSIRASFHELIVAFRFPIDSFGIASPVLLNIASHFSVARSYLIDTSYSEGDSQLIVG